MQVIAGGLPCRADEAKHSSPPDHLASRNCHSGQMPIASLKAIAAVYRDKKTVAADGATLRDNAVGRCQHRGSSSSADVDALMLSPASSDWVLPETKRAGDSDGRRAGPANQLNTARRDALPKPVIPSISGDDDRRSIWRVEAGCARMIIRDPRPVVATISVDVVTDPPSCNLVGIAARREDTR